MVNDHALGATSRIILLSCRAVTLVSSVSVCVLLSGSEGATWLLLDDVKHTVLEGLLVLRESVLLPSVIEDARVLIVPRHTTLEETNASPVVWLLLKFERAAILHELTELRWVATAQFLQRRFNLLLLDVVVLFIL